MTNSVHTNNSAAIALQNLTRTNDRLGDVQSRISTGLKVQGAKDNAAIWAIAQGQRADVGALSAVKQSLDRATSIADVALSAGESVSDLLNQLKEKVVAAKDSSLKTQSRQLLDSDFKALLKAISSQINNASFDGGNLLNGSLTTGIKFLANADATGFVTLSAKDLSLGGAIIELTMSDSLLTLTGATQALSRLDDSITQLNASLGAIGAEAKQIQAHNTFVTKLIDTLESGIGNLVDADLAKESARLQALQVQQQLGAQSLSIANQAPQIILSLFRGG
ncbi:MAG: flagellin [Alphaproteobacteria bacterium]|jgi:flagellin|uniref:flagellin n=1 Tax=Brevundimonas sp. TaxID=1871086 RepID=UPI001823B0D8|nr:flagellin [Brevundimonas sp.]MBU3970073.1 flagellin [Alphaproteobacteria bacterium]MBA3049420.1 flagellin [Brevundimonas sp.]MBU3973722.1 flagellin [Alphaproteobacteria bacterium]MBU4038550.1 flagellin [Alphaproteobacteria bacterium]MBU4136118.1 flagellin [Alphaproteobacteria bacterium]